MVTAILTGGASRRMGRDKAALPWGDVTLLDFQLSRYAPLSTRLLVSVAQPNSCPHAIGEEVVDIIPSAGPLAALWSVLTEAGETVFLTAVDLPLAPAHIAPVIAAACEGYDACLPDPEHPLFGAYSPRCLPKLKALLDKGERAMMPFLRTLELAPVPALEVDITTISINMNTPEEYIKWRPAP